MAKNDTAIIEDPQEVEALRVRLTAHETAVAMKAREERAAQVEPLNKFLAAESTKEFFDTIDKLPKDLDNDSEVGSLIQVLRSTKRVFDNLSSYPSLQK
jgi:hypothetical protein